MRIIIFLSLLSVCLTGCFSSNPDDIRAFMMPHKVNTTLSTYILQPPDEIHILCSEVQAIHDQRQKIRPDGKISLEGVGELEAAGKTPKQLAEEIRLEVIEYYKLTNDDPVDVQISLPQSKFFYVLGQVNMPGPRIYTGRDTALNAISLAEPNPMAWIERIQVIRPSENEDIPPAIFELNFDRMMAHGDTTQNVLLQENDIIYVPPTILGWMSLKIEEAIRPIARAFSGVYTVRRGLNNDSRYYY